MAIDQNVKLQSMLYSFNNSALFIGNDKATVDALVPQMVMAFVQLHLKLASTSATPVHKFQLDYRNRTMDEFMGLIKTLVDMELITTVSELACKELGL
tara:strand:+ start:175 stop:468 length:294 start_codon:yes stop_codon:yes gene_type:complete